VLLLLYAQPVSRIVRLIVGDVIEQDDQVVIELGDPPSPVPQPFGALLLVYHTADVQWAESLLARIRPTYLPTYGLCRVDGPQDADLAPHDQDLFAGNQVGFE
jgi:hypothetical protein